jgi:TolA-binding protein
MADKQQKQEVEVNEVVERARGFWAKYSRTITYVGTAVILLVGGFLVYKHFFRMPKEEKAQDAIFKAQQYFTMDSLNLALNGDGANPGFLTVIKKYGGTDQANLAHFYAGSIYLKKGDYNNAIKYLKDFSTDAKQIQARAWNLLGDAYAESGKKEDALEQYRKAANHFTDDEVNTSEYLFKAGLMADVLNKTKDATEFFRTLKDKYPRSPRSFDAEKYLGKYGELK